MSQIVADVLTERWPAVMAEVAAAVDRRAAAVRDDLVCLTLREVPQLRDDKAMLDLLASISASGRPSSIKRHSVPKATFSP